MSTISDVRNFFITNLSAITPALPNLSYEGSRFEPNGNQSFVRSKVFPNETDNVTIGVNGIMVLRGLQHIDVCVSRVDGYDAGMAIVERILNAFQPGSQPLTTNQIVIYASWVEAVQEDPAYLRFPVFVRWEAYT